MDLACFHQWLQRHNINERSMTSFQEWLALFMQEHSDLLAQQIDEFHETKLDSRIEYSELIVSGDADHQPLSVTVRIQISYLRAFYRKKGVKVFYKGKRRFEKSVGDYYIRYSIDGALKEEEVRLSFVGGGVVEIE